LRQDVITLLAKNGRLSFSELLRETKSEPGTFGYHMKQLGEFVEKDNDKFYFLNDLGKEAFKILTMNREAPYEIKNKPRLSKWIFGLYLDITVIMTGILISVLFDIPFERSLLNLTESRTLSTSVLLVVILLISSVVIRGVRTEYIIKDTTIDIISPFGRIHSPRYKALWSKLFS